MGEREQHEAGLSTAEVEELTRRGEVNHAPDDGMRSTWQIVRANLFTRINAIFAILVALVVATGSLRNALFGLAIVINSIVGIAQELRARHTLKQLSIVNTAEVTVRRDGEAKKIPTTDIVTGDIVEQHSACYCGDGHFEDWGDTLDRIASFDPEAIAPGRGDALVGRDAVTTAIESTRDFVQSTYRPVRRIVARGGSLKQAWDAVRAECDPKFKDYAIYEHCLPFDVTRAYDEASGIRDPRIWTAERDIEMWRALEG